MLYALEEPDGETLRAQVLKVFDGDGFLARATNPLNGAEIEIAVRCGFIDAPEMAQPGGSEARDFLSHQIGGRWLDLGLLMKMDTGGMTDRHRRVVAVPYLWQQDPQSGARYICRNVELEMILNGWAWVLDRYCPPDHYFDALKDAHRNRRGIWARDDNVHPWEFKKHVYRAKRQQQQPNSTGQPAHFPAADSSCPQLGCNGRLVQRSGRFGTFYGCSEFPKCRYARTSL